MRQHHSGVIRLHTPHAEYADLPTGPVLCLLGGIDSNGNSVQIYIDDPQIARPLSTNLFEWAIREELRRKYDGS